MLRAFIAVFFVFTVTGVAAASGPVGVDQPRLQSSLESQEFERTTFSIDMNENGFARWTATYRRDLANGFGRQGLATGSESGAEATSENTSMMPWLIGFGVLALVIVGGSVAYRTGIIGTSTTNRGEDITSSSHSTITEEELMSDEDRVLMLLQDNGGRMRQVNIVDETGWSKSKVSMLLSDMDEENLISKLRVGRENIISITGDEPEAARSPFENDE